VVVLSGVLGVAILVSEPWLIAYLVLLAVDNVWNAMRMAPLVAQPQIFDRLARAGLETLPGLLGCLATASWVDDDLRAAARDPIGERAPRSTAGVLARAATVALAAAGSGYVLLVSLARLNPNVAEGFMTIIRSPEGASVALGFAALAAGISARSAASLAEGAGEAEGPGDLPGPNQGPGPWPRRIIGGLACLVALEVIAAAVQAILHDVEDRWYAPVRLHQWLEIAQAPARWFGDPKATINWSLLIHRPGEFLIGLTSAWLAIKLLISLASSPPGRPMPLDAIAVDRRALGRFLGWWAALTTAILASMPLLALAALALTHFVIQWTAK
jgi:hypothetical protein